MASSSQTVDITRGYHQYKSHDLPHEITIDLKWVAGAYVLSDDVVFWPVRAEQFCTAGAGGKVWTKESWKGCHADLVIYIHTFIVIVSSTRSNTIITIMTIIDYLLYDIVITISITVILYSMRIYMYTVWATAKI